MLNTNQSLLADRAVISVSGADAREFLQGLITNDVRKISPAHAVFAALLSPQGKFLYDFFIVEHEGVLLLDVVRATQAELVKRLTLYKLRSNVEIAALPQMQVAAAWNGTDSAGDVKFADPRLPELGIRVIGAGLNAETHDAYERHRIGLGVPEGGKDLEPNGAFPMQWGYDRLHAIDFNKGCYVGQEVTARSKHIGTIRKMVHQVQAEGDLPARGTPVTADGKEIGQMASSTGSQGLALLNIEAVSSGASLLCAGMAIRARLPAWAA